MPRVCFVLSSPSAVPGGASRSGRHQGNIQEYLSQLDSPVKGIWQTREASPGAGRKRGSTPSWSRRRPWDISLQHQKQAVTYRASAM